MPNMPMVCPACQKNEHEHCQNPGACVCAIRQHPYIQPRGAVVMHYKPDPEAA